MRMREVIRRYTLFERGLTLIGYGLYIVGAFCLIASVRLVLSWNDIEKGFPAGQGFIQTFKAYGAGLFGVSAILAYYVGQWLLQQRLRDEGKVVAARYEGSRLATLLAQDPDFQRAGSFQWRQQVAYDLLPELREYAESDDWDERRFASRTIKEAWEIHRKLEEHSPAG